MTRVHVLALPSAFLLVASAAMSERPATASPAPRTGPAESIVIGGVDIEGVLTLLGARRELGVSDDQLRDYASHFDRSDPDGDRKQTRAEYVDGGVYITSQARAGIFGATDNNADGIMTKVEYVLNRCITDEAKAIVQRTDADRGGEVTRDEFVAGSPIKDETLGGAVFDALDTSGDGVLTVPEYLRVWGGWARPNYMEQEAALAHRLANLADRSGGVEGGRPAGGPPSVEWVFEAMDRDRDGTLTKAEFRGPVQVFLSADTDEDGEVTRAEMEAFRARDPRRGPAISRPGPGP